MSQKEIENFCKMFLKEQYDLMLVIPVKINSRLSSTLGVFFHGKGRNKPNRIEFNKKFMENGSTDDIIQVIVHECVHYALYMLDKPYNDGDSYFEEELIRHRAASTNKIEFSIERNVRVYKCKCTEHVFLSTIRPSTCTKCNSGLDYVGENRLYKRRSINGEVFRRTDST